MTEVDYRGVVLSSFLDVKSPQHLSLDSEGHVLVADNVGHGILLLNSELQQQRVLVDTNSRIKLFWPTQLCYNGLTSQVYVLHLSSERGLWSNVISILNLGENLQGPYSVY